MCAQGCAPLKIFLMKRQDGRVSVSSPAEAVTASTLPATVPLKKVLRFMKFTCGSPGSIEN